MVVDFRRVSACSKAGTFACSRAVIVGPSLREHSPIPHSFLHSHYSGNSAGNCLRTTWRASMMVTVSCIIYYLGRLQGAETMDQRQNFVDQPVDGLLLSP